MKIDKFPRKTGKIRANTLKRTDFKPAQILSTHSKYFLFIKIIRNSIISIINFKFEIKTLYKTELNSNLLHLYSNTMLKYILNKNKNNNNINNINKKLSSQLGVILSISLPSI